ncbi:hypothetical protein WA026_005264 [Henosepilachna vigintioctopunctata]|uniref:Secreted protein n=1 Tax=Henosepilachna vigintioctopunctata TaxID=420089 RepID=A0AAW1UML5_9CUCU
MFSRIFLIFDILFLCVPSTEVHEQGQMMPVGAPKLRCYDTDKFNPDSPEGKKECDYEDSCVRYTSKAKDYQIITDSLKCGTKEACEARGKADKSIT